MRLQVSNRTTFGSRGLALILVVLVLLQQALLGLLQASHSTHMAELAMLGDPVLCITGVSGTAPEQPGPSHQLPQPDCSCCTLACSHSGSGFAALYSGHAGALVRVAYGTAIDWPPPITMSGALARYPSDIGTRGPPPASV